ncbi:MAG: hypothetical protein K2X03_07225 [Bryobacteraceae bacterium]|nr:hypothetical protein [Bryobacteraceae bacterium]
MLRGVLISASREQRFGVHSWAEQTRGVMLLRGFESYPAADDWRRFQNAHAPQVVFLDLDTHFEQALAFAASLEPHLFVVGLFNQPEPQRIIAAMRAGIHEVLYLPFDGELFREALLRLEEAARQAAAHRPVSDQVYAFLPAKAGDGASVVAANAAIQLACLPDNRVLLADLDLYAGLSRFLLKLANSFSAQDALERILEIDDTVWSELVCRPANAGQLEVLGAGILRRPPDQLAVRARRLIDFARRRYRAVCLDLSGCLDELAIEAIQESRRTFLVLTPDLASVYQAREKIRFLQELGLEDRISVILNRWQKDAPIHMGGIEEVLGLPIQHTLPEDRAAVQQATMQGAAISGAASLGKELQKLAYALSDGRSLAQVEPPKRKIEYFTLSPGKYTLLPGR